MSSALPIISPLGDVRDGDVVYPSSDGEPMAENTEQFRWIVTIKEGLEAVFKDRPDVFVAGDLLWYPVRGKAEICQAPDVLVALGRPKGDRGSYRTWDEGGVVPQVVFEILSPWNRASEMRRKLAFYEQHGVQEYYVYNPEENELFVFWREADGFGGGRAVSEWTSPLLGVRFDLRDKKMAIYDPDGRPFATYVELIRQRDAAEQRVEEARDQVKAANVRAEFARAEAESARAEAESARAEAARLADNLRELGMNPDA